MATSHASDHLMTGPLFDYLNALCERMPPGPLLLLQQPALREPCSNKVEPWLASLRQRAGCSVETIVLELPFNFSGLSPRYELCVICMELTSLQRGDWTELLARIKHQYCNHIELIVQHPGHDEDEKARLSLDKTLFGLGFQHTARLALPHAMVECYAYELQRYNKKRSWNSPENWANPENFDKFRW